MVLSLFDTKVAQVHKQLASGDIVITFDPKTENCTLLTRLQFQRTSVLDARKVLLQKM